MRKTPFDDWTEEDLMTACVWAEARGEPVLGQAGVAHVILNRVRKGMAASVKAAILSPNQFSWTNPQDPNHGAVQEQKHTPTGTWWLAQRIVEAVRADEQSDPTQDADHYLNLTATRKARPKHNLPRWAQEGIDQGKVTIVIGHHTFLNLRG